MVILLIVPKGLLVTWLATYQKNMGSLAREITRLIDENYVGDLIFNAEIMLPLT